MKGIISGFLVVFNLLLIFSIVSFDNRKEYSIYASQIGASSTENADTNDLFTFFQNFKANTTETVASATKPNTTETAAVSAATRPKVNESPYAAAIAKLQPGDKVKYCYSFHSKFGTLGSGEGQFNRPHDIVFDSKGFSEARGAGAEGAVHLRRGLMQAAPTAPPAQGPG